MPRYAFSVLFAAASLLCFSSLNAVEDAHTAESFGPYDAITMNKSVVSDVKVDKEGNIFLLLNPKLKDNEIVVKISNEKFAGYRHWWHGEYELISPANNGKVANTWTDRVQTQSNYIEYWMNGDIFLHLKLKLR